MMKGTLRGRMTAGAATFGLALTVLPVAQTMSPIANALDPVGFWDCSGPNCPPGTYPTISNGAIQYNDNSVNVFVGGDLTITGGAAESEGLTVVIGDMSLEKTGGSNRYDVGEAGVGSRVVPTADNDFLVIGGDVNANPGLQIVGGAAVPSTVRHAGTLTGNVNAGTPGTVVQDPAAVTPYDGIPAQFQTLSTCLAGEAANGTVTGGASKTFTGDGSSPIQIFNLMGDIGTAGGNGGITFNAIPTGATVIVNVTGAGTKYLKTWAGGFDGLAGVDREKLLWNITEATDVQMTGVSQWAGSVLIANPASNTVNSYPGINGRFYALGNVEHTGFGTEFHNYPFTGSVPNCEGPPPAPTYDLALQKVVNSVTSPPLLATPNGSVTFDITVTNQDSPVQTIEITDYLGVGTDIDFTYDPADQPGTPVTVTGGDGGTFSASWDAGSPVVTLEATAGQLDNNESVTVPITLDIIASFDSPTDSSFDNASEISRFDSDTDASNGDSDGAGTGTQLSDTDSTPDATDESNAGETVGSTLVDDEITQDGSAGADEDDHDIASLPWYDVALIIERNAMTTYTLDQSGPSTTAMFDITVKNQGLLEVTDLDVLQAIPVGMAFTSFDGVTSGTANVSGAAGSFNIDALDPGEEVTFTVTLTVTDGGAAAVYETTVEVTKFEDAAGNSSATVGGPVDVDSISNTDLTDDTFFLDATNPDNERNSHNQIDYDSGGNGVNNFDGDDEDEHDREVVIIGPRFDQALEKRLVTPVQPIAAGDTIQWELIITNQGDAVQFFRIVDFPQYDAGGANFNGGITSVDSVVVSDGATWALDAGGIANATTPFFELSAPDGATFLDQGETITILISTTVAAGWDGSTLVNWAEIEQFDDDLDRANGFSLNAGTGTQLEDADSTPDFNPTNDNQPAEPGDPTDGEIDEDGKNGGDEDDHDVAAVPIYDIALINTRTAGQPFRISGDDLTVDFDITVKNQGEEIVHLVDVRDHLPTGTSFVSAANVMPSDDAVLTTGPGTATTQDFQIDQLIPGESITWTITVNVDDSSFAEYLNAAEVAAFDDDADPGNGVSPFAVDIDSTPGTGNADVIDTTSAPVNPDDARNSHNDIDNDRDNLQGDGTGDHIFRADLAADDEDDHDRELVVLPFDLALRKVLDGPPAAVSNGSKIGFLVTVFNQGRDVNGVDLADYIGANFDYIAADNAVTATNITTTNGDTVSYAWGGSDVTAANGTVSGAFTGAFTAGDSVDIPITLTVDIGAAVAQLDNYAEISRFDDDNDGATGDSSLPGTGGLLVDIDSTPDSTDTSNDGEDIEQDMVDNAIDGDRKGDATADEDDHDIASTRWFDLSLIKKRSTGQAFLLDPTTGAITVNFDITVTNQGPNTNYDIDVTDYIPDGLVYDSLGTVAPGTVSVSAGAGTATTQLFTIDQLDTTESVTFTTVYTIAIAATTPGTFVNEAEISAMDGDFDFNGDGTIGGAERGPVSDIDSTPNAVQGDDAFDPGDPTDATDIANGVLDPLDGHNDPDVDSANDGINNFDGDDEDDADSETFQMPVDLALSKRFDDFTTDPVFPTGKARFEIEIYNQGLVPVESIEVTDYVQTGFTFDIADNGPGNSGPSTGGDWNIGGTTVGTFATPAQPVGYAWAAPGVATLTGVLAPGESITVPVVLTIDPTADFSTLLNKAEISSYDDDGDASTTPRPELDSTPDGTDDDNQPADPGDPTDDAIDNEAGPGGDDEDDHDIAGIPIVDLTLVKQRSAGQTYVVGGDDQVSFDITVKNQGSEPAFDIAINDDQIVGNLDIDGAATDAGLPGATPAVTRSGEDYAIDRLDPGAEVTWTVVYDIGLLGPNGRIVNAAEIESFEDVDNVSSDDPGGPVDFDSMPDGDLSNDLIQVTPGTPDVADSHNDIDLDFDNDTNVNEPTPDDEDDHDSEAVVVNFDLALRKTIDTGLTNSPLERGDTVYFEIEVINQGVRPVQQVEVTDTYDASLWSAFDTGANPGGATNDSLDGDSIAYAFTDNGGGSITITLTGDALDPDESVTIPMSLTSAPTLAAQTELVNTAEISRFDDNTDPGDGDSSDPDPDNPFQDDDSTPNGDPTDDGTPIDDEVDGEPGGMPDDEDDHDPASVTLEVFDLAIRKRSVDVDPLPSAPGVSKVTFELEVINQGSINATDVLVSDYIQDGFTFVAADNQPTALRNVTWAGIDGDLTVTTVIPLIFAQRSITVDIVLLMETGDDPTSRFNFAEVSAADDDGNGATPPPTDIDSTPDGTNDEVTSSYEDDELDEDALTPGPDTSGDGTVDEDDHDGAVIELPMFDLALRKTVSDTATNVIAPGGDVTFTIEVFNQGEIDANDIDIVDYLPAEMSVSPNDTNGWVGTTGDVTNTIAGPIAVGTSATIDIVVRLADGISGEIVNAVEITRAEDENDNPRDDVDSTPNNDNTDDEDPVDDEIENGDGDEDDHDIEVLTIELSSLGDKVWIDFDRDGLQDDDEPPVAGVTVVLLDSNGDPTGQTTVTDADGMYIFDDLVPGTYKVRFDLSTLPEGFTVTTQDANGGAADATDSDVDPVTGEGAFTLLDPGESDPTHDMGLAPPNFDLEATKAIEATDTGTRLAVWSLRATNVSGVDAPGPVTIIDRLPANQTFVRMRNTTAECSAVGQVVTCVFADGIAANASVSSELVATVAPNSPEIANSMEVIGPFGGRAELVRDDNTVVVVVPFDVALPATGSSPWFSIRYALTALGLGVIMLIGARRRRSLRVW